MEPKLSKEVREFLELQKSQPDGMNEAIDKVLQGDPSVDILSVFRYFSVIDGEQIQGIAEYVIGRKLSLEELAELISCAIDNGSWYDGLYDALVGTLTEEIISEEERAELGRKRDAEWSKLIANRTEVNPDEDF